MARCCTLQYFRPLLFGPLLLTQRFIFCLVFAAGLPCAQPAEQFDDVRGRAELAAIDRLSETSVLDALRRLEALEAQLGPAVSYGLRDMLRAEVWMREDAGQLDRSYAADEKALQLAIANHDAATAVLARLGKVRQMLDQNRLGEAQAALNAVLATFPKERPVLLAVVADSVQGDVSNAQARFDLALASFLSALKREEPTPNAGELRAPGHIDELLGRVLKGIGGHAGRCRLLHGARHHDRRCHFAAVAGGARRR